MMHHPTKGRSVLWFLTLLLLLTGSLQAATKPVLSKQSFRILQQTQEWLDGGETARAVERLGQLVRETAEKPYEQAIVLQNLGYAQIVGEDYPKAIVSFRRSLGLNRLPEHVQQELRYNLAQLLMAGSDFSAAIDVLQQWLKQSEAPTAEAYVMLGSAYLQTRQFKPGIAAFEQAIALSSAPRESWYQNLLAAYSEVKDTPSCIRLLNTMIRKFPARATYWQQLAAMELSRQHYAEAVAVMELAYKRGYLKSERELLNLANLYAYLKAPFKSARLLEDGISSGRITPSKKNLEQGANAWYQAREYQRAIALLERAVTDDRDPPLALRLSQLYMADRQWAGAERNLRLLLAGESSDKKQSGKAWMLLGITLYEQKKMAEAEKAFLAAGRYPGKQAEEARQWLGFLSAGAL